MNVRLGWSGDIHGTWTKMDVEVDESDYQNLLAEHGLSTETAVTPIAKFKILYTMAEIFVQLHKMSRFPDVFGQPHDHQALQDLVTAQKNLIAGYGE